MKDAIKKNHMPSGEGLEKNFTSANAGVELVKLVLSVVNLLRELMEKQALHKMEKNLLSSEKIEEMGATFLALEETIERLKDQFGLTSEDLQIDLGKYINFED